MKALIASFVLVGVAVIGLLVLLERVSSGPMHEVPLAAAPVPTRDVIVTEAAGVPLSVLPTVAAPRATAQPKSIAMLPTRTVPPTPTASPLELQEAWAAPTALPTLVDESREGCDPAYPDEPTCIPPGPPFDQGCAVTDERRFTVLPPDPQALDHDGDGIGCEPIGTD